MQRIRLIHFLIFSLIVFFAAQSAAAQKGNLQIDYTVSLAAPESQTFHVTTDIKNIKQERLDLSLPTWTPGWYTIENYAKNFLRFKITDANGKVLPHTMSRKQTWNVVTKNIGEIKVEFDYSATTLALNQAKIAKDFAFFTGTELFLQPEGHRKNPSTVHFAIPQNWKIISALKETSDPKTFTATDYDTLVDAPTEMGSFDVTNFTVEGKPHYFIATPAGAFSADKSKRFTDLLAKAAIAESAIFGGLPYEKHVYFYFFLSPESNASGALEHLNSHVSFAPPNNAQPERMINTAAHEFFHLWNVKRIRPAEMYPYDYSREDETPLLWVSEGFTNYYASVATYRAGIITPRDFLDAAGRAIGGVENNEARGYISPAASSVSTWLGYDTPQAFDISYYTQGQNLGALLDLSIRRDTDGQSTLDDVMRSLYKNFYQRNKGFTTEDMISEINRLTKKDYRDFYQKYVFGTEVPNYDEIYGYAGYTVVRKVNQIPVYGFNFRNRNGGLVINSLDANSPAATATQLQVGDIITKINGAEPQRAAFGEFAGKTIKLTIKRGSDEREVSLNVGSRDQTAYSLVESPQATAQQLKIREGWLKK